MVEPTACSPAAGWEKGQVEHQVQTIRGRFFKPRLRFASLEELNGWLEAECLPRCARRGDGAFAGAAEIGEVKTSPPAWCWWRRPSAASG